MAATARYDVGYLDLLSRDTHDARVALVGVGVTRDQRVRADASRVAGVINPSVQVEVLIITANPLAELTAGNSRCINVLGRTNCGPF